MGLLARIGAEAARLAGSPAARKQIVNNARRAGAAAKEGLAKTVQFCRYWRPNRAIRKVYKERARQLKTRLSDMEKKGVPLRDRAKHAFESRKSAMEAARKAMPNKQQVESLKARDKAVYRNGRPDTFEKMELKAAKELQDRLNRQPTIQEVHQEIIESSTRTNTFADMMHLVF